MRTSLSKKSVYTCMNGIMNRKLREKTEFEQSLHNFTKRGFELKLPGMRSLALDSVAIV